MYERVKCDVEPMDDQIFFCDTVYLQIRIPNNNSKDSKDIDEKTMK